MMINVCSKKTAFILTGVVFCCLFLANSVKAGETDDIQPASDVIYGERLRVNSAASVAEPSYFYKGIHLGSTGGTGGVTFANGTIINASDSKEPVTFGD